MESGSSIHVLSIFKNVAHISNNSEVSDSVVHLMSSVATHVNYIVKRFSF